MIDNKIIQIGFLIFPGFPMACLTSMIEPLRAANEISGRTMFEWTLVSEQGDRVQASANVWFDPDRALSDCAHLDQIFLLSGPSSKFENAVSSNGILRKLARFGVVMGAVSGGVFPLARAGLLEGHTSSVHWCYEAAFAAEFPNLAATQDVIVKDRRCLTASGAAAAFDLSLLLIEEQLDASIATEVACWFQHPLVRGQGVTQRKPAVDTASTDDMLPDLVRQAVTIFTDHIEETINIADVAAEIGISVRQLERMFQKATGNSPHGYYKLVRMKKARQLLLYSKNTMTEIAFAVGYTSPSTLNKSYFEVFGVSPKDDRAKVNMFRVRENAIVPSA